MTEDRAEMADGHQDSDVEAHRLATNDNETVVEDDGDVEAHRLASNDNETVVEDD
ncbi:MAG TPA: hypothetical protein VFK35_06035 [Candidatus Limnocylindrales bacterium]|nr:hypothetical protein [Candidatus Limnocylindrales bacterium]